MKKNILISLCFFIAISSNGQNKSKPNIFPVKDSVQKVKPDTAYQITLSKEEFLSIVDIVRSLDEKPSVIKAWLQEHIYSKTRQVLIPKEIKK